MLPTLKSEDFQINGDVSPLVKECGISILRYGFCIEKKYQDTFNPSNQQGYLEPGNKRIIFINHNDVIFKGRLDRSKDGKLLRIFYGNDFKRLIYNIFENKSGSIIVYPCLNPFCIIINWSFDKLRSKIVNSDFIKSNVSFENKTVIENNKFKIINLKIKSEIYSDITKEIDYHNFSNIENYINEIIINRHYILDKISKEIHQNTKKYVALDDEDDIKI